MDFNHVVHIVFTVPVSCYHSNFTLKIRYNKDEKTASYLELSLVHDALINRYCDETKVCNEVIDQHAIVSSSASTYNASFEQKR